VLPVTTGEKIKYIRSFRGMTQQELGVAIGLPAKGADNRIAQYETNYRVPKKDMLMDMAKALNVNYINFIPPASGAAEDIMQTFFWLDVENPDMLNFFPVTPAKRSSGTTNGIKAQYDASADISSSHTVGLWFNYSLVNDFMYEWMLRKEELANGKITPDKYLKWKLNWPDTCTM